MTDAAWVAFWQSQRGLPGAGKPDNPISKRKTRLLACACWRVQWESLPTRARELIQLAELHADRKGSPDKLPANERALYSDDELIHAANKAAYRRDSLPVLTDSIKEFLRIRFRAAFTALSVDGRAVSREESSRLRNIVSEPAVILVKELFGPQLFHPVVFQPAWRTRTTVTLARQMYDSRDFSAMPILADALQDAGCNDADILNHCRAPQVHVRGCWVVDLVLGKE